MKKAISILLAVMLIFAISVPAYAADSKPTAAFVTFGLGGDFFQALADTFVTTMEAEGWNAEYTDGQFNPTAQIDAMENYIAKGVGRLRPRASRSLPLLPPPMLMTL